MKLLEKVDNNTTINEKDEFDEKQNGLLITGIIFFKMIYDNFRE